MAKGDRKAREAREENTRAVARAYDEGWRVGFCEGAAAILTGSEGEEGIRRRFGDLFDFELRKRISKDDYSFGD
jgi:hypothetical protein